LLVFIIGLALILLAILQKPKDPKLIFAFWVVFFLGYLTKPLIVFFIFPYIAMVLQIEGKTRKHILSFSALYILILSTFLWFFWISNYLEDWQYFQPKISFNPKIIMQNYARYIAHLKFYEFMPALYTIALLEVLRGITALFKKRRIAKIEELFIGWLLFGWLFLGFISYSPPRYSLVLLPAILALNGLFFSEMLSKRRDGFRYGASFSFMVIALICLLQIAFGFYRIIVYKHIFPSCFLPILGLLALGGLWLAARGHLSRTVVGWGLLSFFLVVQGFQIIRFYVQREFSLYSAIQDVAQVLRQDNLEKTVLAGDIAPLVAYEIRHPVMDIMYRTDKLSERVRRMQPRYLFLEDPTELSRLKKEMPNDWLHLTVIRRYRILNNYKHGQDAILYRLNN